jgi:hypothetical protein
VQPVETRSPLTLDDFDLDAVPVEMIDSRNLW